MHCIADFVIVPDDDAFNRSYKAYSKTYPKTYQKPIGFSFSDAVDFSSGDAILPHWTAEQSTIRATISSTVIAAHWSTNHTTHIATECATYWTAH